MKILITGRGFDSLGNHQLGLFEIDQALALRQAGHDVRFGAIDTRSVRRVRPWGSREYTLEGIPVFYCSIPVGAIPRFLGEKAQHAAAKAIWKRVTADGWRPDVIHAHFGSGFLFEGKKHGIPIVYTEHFSAVNTPNPSKYELSREQTYYAMADRLLCVSRTLRDRIEEHTGARPHVINNIVEVDTFTPLPVSEKEDGRFLFAATGNLLPEKGFGMLIQAFARVKKRVPSAELTIVGQGALARFLRELAEKLGVSDSVHFTGWLSRSEIAKIYRSADAFVLASQGETFGVAYAEALAAGLPVIATRCGGPEEFVDESNGILIPVDDQDALEQAMIKMTECCGQYDRTAISRTVRERFSPRNVAAALQETYEDLFREKASPEKKLRVLVTGRGFDSVGKHDLGIFELDQAKALSEAGHDVRFAAIDTRSLHRIRAWGRREYLLKGVHVFYCAIPAGSVPRSFGQWAQQHAAERLRNSIQATGWKPDVIHSHFGSGFLNVAKSDGIPYVYTEHSSLVNRETVPTVELRWEKDTYPRADRVICVSSTLAGRVLERTGIKARVIHNMVDIREFTYTGRPAPGDSFRFVATGLLIQRKGYDLLLNALAEVRKRGVNATLTIIGEGKKRSSLESQIETLGLEGTVRFLGQQPRKVLAEEYARSDAFVLPSRRETFGVVYAEAMAAGLPVIATRCGGPEDFVEESTGILIPTEDVKALEEAMVYMAENRESYDSAAIAEYALENFAPERIAAKLTEVYKEIV